MTPREKLEVRLTALLLGELPSDEAAALRDTIAKDPELARLHQRLQQTIGLVREAGTVKEQEVSAGAAMAEAPQLSAERRENLLATFKTVRPRELPKAVRSPAPRRELLALAAMIVALFAVGALVVRPPVARENSQLPASSFAQWKEDSEEFIARESEQLNREKVVRELRGKETPPALSADPATSLSSSHSEKFRELSSDFMVADPAKAPKRVADLPAPSLPADETPRFALAPQTPPPAAQPPSVSDEFKSIPARRSNIALPVAEDSLAAVAEGEVSRQLARKDSVERGLASNGQLADQPAFIGGQGGGGGGGRIGGGRGRTPAPDGNGPAEAQLNWSFAGGEYAGVSGPGSGSVPIPGAAPLPALQNPASQSSANLDGAQSKEAAFGGLVAITNGVTIAAKFAEITPQANDGFFFSDLGGFAGRNIQSLERRNESVNQSQFGTAPLDALGDSQRSAFGRDASGNANRFYSLSGVANGRAVGEQKRDVDNDTMKRDEKLAALSDDKKLGVVTGGTALAFDVQTGKPVSGPQPEARQKSAESLTLEKAEKADALSKNRVEIALPQVERGDALEKLQVGSGPVAANEPATASNRPAPVPGDVALAVEESRGRSMSLQSGNARPMDEAIKHLPPGVPFIESDSRRENANLSQVLDRYAELTGQVVLRPSSIPEGKVGWDGAKALTREEETKVLGEVLSANGITLVPRPGTKFVKAVGEAQAGTTGAPFSELQLDLLRRSSGYLTQVVRVTNTSPETVRAALQSVGSPSNTVQTIAGSELLVLRDKEENVRQMLAVVRKIEASQESEAKQDNVASARRIAAPMPQPEVATVDNAFSTFSLNVSDVSFKLAAASLEKGQMPDPATVRSEEFINAFDYRDPEPTGRAPIAFAWERARYPFAHDRDLVRLSVKTAAAGRQSGRPLNLVLLLDNSGSMERADRLRIRQECLRVLAGQLRPEDRVSVVAFARTARLWVDGLSGAQAGELAQRVGSLTPEGGTNLEDAMNLAYQTALRHFQANGVNRVVLLTDGAANLGDVQPESLKKKVEGNRRQGIALDCFGLGWDGYNDDLLEVLSRNGDGRYGFINTPEAAASDFAGQLAGALKVAASDVKVQVEWNPRRVTAYRQIGYAKHQLKKEQFRDNTVDAAEIGAAEAGNALYVVQVNPRGEGPLGTMRVRFKVPGTADYREQEWPLAYDGAAKSLENATPALRLAASASAFSEWLVSSPYAAEVTPDRLLGYLSGVPEQSPADPRPKKLEWMIRQAKSLSGK